MARRVTTILLVTGATVLALAALMVLGGSGRNGQGLSWPVIALTVVSALAGALVSAVFSMKRSMPGGIMVRFFLVVFSIVLLVGALAEYYLRHLGYLPGLIYQGFYPVDSLVEDPYYLVDSNGLISLDPAGVEWSERNYTINAQGFRSRLDYTPQVVDSVRGQGDYVVAVFGDSHTEGCWASTIDKAYTDLLDSQPGRTVLNFGVGGTDPVQYRLAAGTYLPLLRPDHAVVSVCLVTDNLEFMRRPSPGIPIHFTTNAGWLSSQLSLHEGGQPNQLFQTAQEAYNYYLNRYTLLGENRGPAARQAARLSITTALWRLVRKRKALDYQVPPPSDPGIYTYQCLRQIADLCDSLEIAFTIAAIPPVQLIKQGASVQEIRNGHSDMFRELEWHLPTNIAPDDYASGPLYGYDDIHFNDSGHRKFAHFLDSLLSTASRRSE